MSEAVHLKRSSTDSTMMCEYYGFGSPMPPGTKFATIEYFGTLMAEEVPMCQWCVHYAFGLLQACVDNHSHMIAPSAFIQVK